VYLRGPSNLVFHDQSEQVHVIRAIAPVERWEGPDEEAWTPSNGLIPNGNFRNGLSRWQVFPESHDASETGVSVGDHGLRLWAEKESRSAGVEQIFNPPITAGNRGSLNLDFQISKQAQRDGFTSLKDFPLRLDVFCQIGTGHKATKVYSWVFSVSVAKKSAWRKRTVQVPLGRWFHFKSSPSTWSNRTCRIKSIRLAGGGMPERDVWVRQIGVEDVH